MVGTLQQVLEGVLERLHHHVVTYLPSLLAAMIFFVGAYVMAVLARWLIHRIFKGLTIDRFLRQSGVAYLIDSSGRLRASSIAAQTAYWSILLTGVLTGLSVFDTTITTQMVEGFVFLLPKLVMGGLLLLGGAWLSQYLGREMLVWAVNEDLPGPRRLAMAVRLLILFVTVVVVADQLNFARSVFLAAFVIIVGGAVLAASLAAGLAASGRARQLFDGKSSDSRTSDERSLWNHL
ncbi:MAG: mechanosensitive ion channel family protein [Bryobacteraceae bacterium]